MSRKHCRKRRMIGNEGHSITQIEISDAYNQSTLIKEQEHQIRSMYSKCEYCHEDTGYKN